MNTRDHSFTLLCLAFFCPGLMIVSNGQENLTSSQDGEKHARKTEKGFKIRIGVEEVRLDAVVLDQQGRQITDLTADDLEIYQDGSRQKITSCTYINDYRPQPEIRSGTARDSGPMPPLPAPMLTREDVRRTIVFVVDDLTMDHTQVLRARTALQKFVESQMQQGDLVAIVPTAGGNAGLQMFSSDKQHLLSIIGGDLEISDYGSVLMSSRGIGRQIPNDGSRARYCRREGGKHSRFW